MPDSLIGFLPHYELSQDNECVTLKIDLDQIIDFSHVSRDHWSDSIYQNGLIWLAGGGAYLLQNRYVVLVRRSMTAPSNPGCLTLSTGLSDGLQEWADPSLIRREMFEEVVLLDRKQQFYYYPKCDSIASQVVEGALLESPFQNWRAQGVSSQYVTSLQHDRIVITQHEKQNIFEGLLHLNGNQVNFLFAIELQLPQAISEIEFYDSEFKIENGNKIFLKREIFLYDLKTERVLDLKMQMVSGFSFTEHAQFFIKKLRTNWRE